MTESETGGKGSYTIIIELSRAKWIKIGALGNFFFEEGAYAYTGSAMGVGAQNLKRRLSRHLSKKRSLRWHVDYLIEDGDAKIVGYFTIRSDVNLECTINKYIKRICKATIPVPNFGSTDCKSHCGSHLLYLGREAPLNAVQQIYKGVESP